MNPFKTLKDRLLSKKQARSTTDSPEAQNTGSASSSFESAGPPERVRKERPSLSGLAEKLTVPRLLGIGAAVLVFVFIGHIVYGAIQAHRQYLQERDLLTRRSLPVVTRKFARQLPPIVTSADNLYQGLAKLSEFSKIRVHYVHTAINPAKRMQVRDAESFTEWAQPLGLIKNVYMGKVRIVVNGPITVAGVILPQIHNLFMKNSGIVESVEFYKETSGKTSAAGIPKLIISGTLYGSPPAGAPQGVAAAKPAFVPGAPSGH